MKKNWLKEGARDIIALGSIPFFIIVLIRVSMLDKPFYFFQFLIGSMLFLILFAIFKQNVYAGLGLIVVSFTSLYYDQMRFMVFAIILYGLAIASLFYLKYDKKNIIKGIVFGFLSMVISYLIVKNI